MFGNVPCHKTAGSGNYETALRVVPIITVLNVINHEPDMRFVMKFWEKGSTIPFAFQKT
jgi:hypothetical protein